VDGTWWTVGVKGGGKSLKFSGQPSNHENACKSSTASETGERVAGAIVRRVPQPEKLINWEGADSYSISCPLELQEGRYYASCPI